MHLSFLRCTRSLMLTGASYSILGNQRKCDWIPIKWESQHHPSLGFQGMGLCFSCSPSSLLPLDSFPLGINSLPWCAVQLLQTLPSSGHCPDNFTPPRTTSMGAEAADLPATLGEVFHCIPSELSKQLKVGYQASSWVLKIKSRKSSAVCCVLNLFGMFS